MWEKHIEPRIQAGLTHKSVPDKRRWERDNIQENIDFSDTPEMENSEELKTAGILHPRRSRVQHSS